MNKSIKFFLNWFLGPALFLFFSFSIYNQIRSQPGLEASWQEVVGAARSTKLAYLLGALALVPVNWGLEAGKWRLSLLGLSELSFRRSFKAVIAGVSFSVTLPNRVGEYLGRVLYLPDGSRLRAVSATVVGSIAQLLVTLAGGAWGLQALGRGLLRAYPALALWWTPICWVLGVGIVLLLLLYFRLGQTVGFVRRWAGEGRFSYLLESLRNFNVQRLGAVLLLSFLRYLVFLAQYVLLFKFFGVEAGAAAVAGVMGVLFLALAVIPTIALAEIGLRGELALKLMGLYSANSLGIGLTMASAWFLNLILPAVAGSLLLLRINLLEKKHEKN